MCSPKQIALYLARLSGPLLDRIDIHIEVPSLAFDDMASSHSAEPSSAVRARVQAARRVQGERFKDASAGRKSRHVHCNAQMGPRHLKAHCKLDAGGVAMLRGAVEKLGLSARAYDRILKVARTIADLEGSAEVRVVHLSEAIQYRTLDRKSRGVGIGK